MSGRPAYTDEVVTEFKDLVCRTALNLMSEGGEHALSFRALASTLGCSHTRVHRYFENKDALLWAVRDYAYGLFIRSLGSSVENAERSMLRAMGRGYFSFAHEDPEAFRILFGSMPPPDREPGDNQKHAWRAIREPIAGAVAAGQMQGDPDVLTYVFWAAIHGVSSLSLSGNIKPGVDPMDVLEATFDGLGRGHGVSQ